MQRGWVVSPYYRSVIEAVSKMRRSLGIPQRKLARRLHKPPSFINKIEQLERRLDVLEFIAIAKALNINPTDLLETAMSALPDEFEL